ISDGAKSSGIDLAGIDKSVAPGDDFFAYANGNWVKSTEIPADRSTWGSGEMLAELTGKRTADLIAKAAKAAPKGSDAAKDRDYYLDGSARMNDIRNKYRQHLARILALARIDNPDDEASRIFDLEHQIAQAHVSRADSEDVLKGNNHWSRQDFDTKAPGLDWQSFFSAANLVSQTRFVVWQPSAVSGISAHD